ncbi:MAG: hypothetical protein REI94_20165 [Moraxellaceae bacterium]|nr:hypothetical protein [Moraxellaceae bacterium]
MPRMKFNADTPLYSSDSTAWKLDQLHEALLRAYAMQKPVVIFVHGRGKEPGKSLKGGTYTKGMAVHKIERGYNTSVIMFNWDSAFRGLNIFDREVPLSHTGAGAIAFGKTLSLLAEFQKLHPELQRPALLVHSMGSVVIQRAILDHHWPEQRGLFSSVLLSQPDADDRDHDKWLEPLARQETTYVTLNQDDHVLLRSTDARPPGTQALGLGAQRSLAANAKYIDLSRMGGLGAKDDDHEVFGKGAMNAEIHVCQFFEQAITGRPVVLDPAKNVETVERNVIFRLKSHRDPGAPCLRLPELPDEEESLRDFRD